MCTRSDGAERNCSLFVLYVLRKAPSALNIPRRRQSLSIGASSTIRKGSLSTPRPLFAADWRFGGKHLGPKPLQLRPPRSVSPLFLLRKEITAKPNCYLPTHCG